MLFATAISLLVLAGLLAIPVTLSYQLNWQRKLRGKVRLRWLFGLVHVRLAQPGDGQFTSEDEAFEGLTEPKKKSVFNKFSPVAALRQKNFRQRILRFARDIWNALRKQDVCLRIRVGLGDPAETGQLWALFGPLSGLLANIEDASVKLEPEFVEAVFELDSSGKISIVPLHLVYLLLRLLCSPSFWYGMKRMRQTA